MNNYRTFLPYMGLVIAIAGAAPKAFGVARLDRQRSWRKIAATCLVALFLCANAYATFQRNKVWKTDETLWHDVVLKSPGNGRGLVAYGIALMDKGEFASAIDYFRRAQQLTPQNYVLFINLAIAENETEQSAAAEQHFKEALRLAPWSANSYIYYARYLLSHSRVDEARTLLHSAPDSSPNDVTTRKLLKETEAMARDSALFGLPGAPIGQALNSPGPQTPEFYLALSAQFYREGRYVESIFACRRALDLRPGYAEAWNNIGAAYNKLGRYEEAAAACEQALLYKPGYENARINLQYAREKIKRSGR
jgi:Flp pilus assembly protein TadD